MVLRSLAERFFRNRAIKRRMNVNGLSVPILVSPDAQLKYLRVGGESFDRDLIEIAEVYLNAKSIVWDIGANVGVFTFAAATIATQGSVVAVEADTWLVGLLRKTSQFSKFANKDIAIIPAAISEKASIACFLVALRGRASNTLEDAGGSTQMGGTRERQHVATTTLDTLLDKLKAPDFVKIDVEGAELMALKGAQRVIAEARPIFYIEVSTKTSGEVLDLFTSANYSVFDQNRNEVSSIASANSFFVPNEKVADFVQSAAR